MKKALKKEKISENKFTLLLISFISLVLLLPFIEMRSRGWEALAIYTIILISAIYALRKHKIHFIFSSVIALIGCSSHLSFLITGIAVLKIIGSSFYLVFYVLFIQAILSDILKSKNVTADTFCGAICAYFMLGIFYGSIYSLIEYFMPGSFSGLGNSGPNPIGEKLYMNVLYFSFMTLTTIGYGDIVPIGNLAKSFVILEGITGVFYIGILVSHLVSGVPKKQQIDN
jgi:hypothetical protein